MTTNTDGAMPELPENIREGAPYDNARFEELCREHDIWGTAESAMCAVFWRTAIQQAAGAVPEVMRIDLTQLYRRAKVYSSVAASPHYMTFTVEALRSLIEEFASTAPPKQQPVHLVGGEVGGVPQWQPIETAPKDGTYILLGSADGAWVARFHAVYQSGYRPENPWQSMMLNHEHLGRYPKARPTHWMPLPPPPARGNDAPTSQINKPAGQGMEGGDHG